MARTQSLTWRAVRLAGELRRLREALGLSLQHVATEMGWHHSKLSRIERAEVGITPDDVGRLLDLYGVTSQKRASLMDLAEHAEDRGWWTAFGDVFTGSYMDMEDAAIRILTYEALAIPGLLQTIAYAQAFLRAGLPDASSREIDQHLRARMARKTLLTRDNAPEMIAVIDEAAIRRMEGDEEIFPGQIRALLEASSNVTVQILPFAATWHAAMAGSVTVLQFGEDVSDRAYVEHVAGDNYVESVEAVNRCSLVFEAARDAALSPEDSAAWLAALAKEHEDHD